jgi:hypothetical protein
LPAIVLVTKGTTPQRDYVAAFPDDRRFQNLGVEAAPGLDAFQDQKVGRTGGNLDVGG